MWKTFISLDITVECLAISVVLACFMCVVCLRPAGILQALGYGNLKLLGWARKKGNLAQPRLTLLALCTFLSSATISACFAFTGRWAAIISLLAYVIFFAVYFTADARHTFRTPLKLTARFKRLYATLFLTFAILAYIIVTALNFIDHVWGNALFCYLRYSALAVFPLLALPILCLANLIAKAWEAPISARYERRAKASLAEAKIPIIAITGSFGKTSVKNILTAMLTKKYRTLATPLSYNTPLGIAKTVEGANLQNYEIFIAEMGARRTGDIARLCEICPPDYSIICGICPQHLESFKSLENVVAAKGKIIPPTKNACYVSASCYDYFKCAEKAIRSASVSEVKADCKGTEFTLTLGGEKRRIKTKLLGEHSAYNIGLCAEVAYALGVSIDDIAETAEALPYVEHRLQLIEKNGVNILDDGYNSNVVGAQAALDVLRTFAGRKIVVTPGLVELGVLEEEENGRLGESLAGLDKVILVGETLVRAVEKGYLRAGGNAENLQIVPTLTEAQSVLSKMLTAGDTVLFLNDLPDMYL